MNLVNRSKIKTEHHLRINLLEENYKRVWKTYTNLEIEKLYEEETQQEIRWKTNNWPFYQPPFDITKIKTCGPGM